MYRDNTYLLIYLQLSNLRRRSTTTTKQSNISLSPFRSNNNLEKTSCFTCFQSFFVQINFFLKLPIGYRISYMHLSWVSAARTHTSIVIRMVVIVNNSKLKGHQYSSSGASWYLFTRILRL